MSKIHVLHVEDNEADALLIQHALELEGFDTEVTIATSPAEYRAGIEKGDVDLILSDHGLPGFSGSAALRIARETCPEIPFIFVSGSANEQEVSDGLKAGASDYVLKGDLLRLADAVRRATAGIEHKKQRPRGHGKTSP